MLPTQNIAVIYYDRIRYNVSFSLISDFHFICCRGPFSKYKTVVLNKNVISFYVLAERAIGTFTKNF